MGIRLISTGSALPERCVTNEEIMKLVDTDNEWIKERSGIEQRYIATTESSLDLAKAASLDAINKAGASKDELDLMIFCTVTPDQIVPAMSSALKMELGLENVVCFDVNAACSAFVYAMWMAESLLLTGKGSKALIVCSERLSRVIDWTNRNTCILFGDGAGAAILENDSSKPGIIGSYIKNYNDKDGVLDIGMNYIPIPFYDDKKNEMYIKMNGQAVFKFAVISMTDAIQKVLDDTGVTADEIKYYVPHQANKRIIQAAAKRFKQPLEKFKITVDRYANISAATIPIALNELFAESEINPGDKIMIAGFGGGLSAAAMLIEM